jgi:hypothetical protein
MLTKLDVLDKHLQHKNVNHTIALWGNRRNFGEIVPDKSKP